jgi:N-acetylmuramoyl-L-alanine amidase
MIDPGHGGKDPGAIGPSGVQEKDVVFAIAKQLEALINRTPNMHAYLTREGDYYVTLLDRLSISRRKKPDLFISIHADSYFNTRAHGASVYALSQHGATTVAAKWLVKRENYYAELNNLDLKELDDQSYLLRSVLIDLAQTATIRDSLRFANALLDSLESTTRLHYSRVELAPFMVLKAPDVPSILVETGFISNVKEESHLRQLAFQHKMALALYQGIYQYQLHCVR